MDNFHERRALPEGWEWKRLGNVAEYINGRAFKPTEWDESGKPIIRIQNLTNESNSFNYFNGECKQTCCIKNGDILISWSASLGVFIWNRDDAVLNQHIFKAIPNETMIDRHFFVFVARTVIEEMERKTHGSTMKHIVKSEFNNIKIPLPPLPTQRRIVSILEKAEETKKLRAQADELTDRLLQSVFMEMFGDPVRNPKGWEMVMLGNVVEQSMNGFGRRSQENLEKKPIVLRIKDVQNGYIDISSPRRITMSSEEYQQYQLKKNDFLYVRVNGSLELVGKSAIIPDIKEEVTFSDHIVRVRFYQTKICSMYIHFLAQTSYFRSNLLKQVVTTAGQNSLGFNRLAQIIIPLPPLPLQQKFARIVKKIEAMRQSQNNQSSR